MHLDEITQLVARRERELLAGPLTPERAQALARESLLLAAEVEEHRRVIIEELKSLGQQEQLALALGQALEPSMGRAVIVDIAG
ncbi:MAG: hypothetical protein NTV70_06870 [Acidobacteria bacterium]|nr:hypothetical protein [Acidobacteriota bacterium]